MGLPESSFSPNDEWKTPPEVLDPIVEHFGGIAFDPYASPQSLVDAQVYVMRQEHIDGAASMSCIHRGLTVVGDGNSLSWPGKGLCFANPPFGRGSFTKAVLHWREQAARGVELIGLVPVRTGGSAWQKHLARANRTVFWPGRMHFLSTDAEVAALEKRLGHHVTKSSAGLAKHTAAEVLWRTDPAPFHTALVYWGPRPDLFELAFAGMWLLKGG